MQQTESDPELKAMASSELREVRERLPAVEERLLAAMVPSDDADDGSAIVEIRAGTGGTEAAIFAKDLYRLYQHLSQLRGWKVQVLTSSHADAVGADDGFKEVTFSVNGQDAFGSLKVGGGVAWKGVVAKEEEEGGCLADNPQLCPPNVLTTASHFHLCTFLIRALPSCSCVSAAV